MDKMLLRTVEQPEIRKAEESRKMTFVASDSSRDTAHTVLNMEGWDLRRFNNNGIIGYQHNVYGGSWSDTENPDNVIGKGFAYVEGGKLMVDVEFEPAEINELADKVYKKLQFGSLKAVSVGFLPLGKGHFGDGEEAAGKSNETYYYEGQELLEVSIVNIPANPNALKKSAELASEEIAALRAAETSESEEKALEEAKKAQEDEERAAKELAEREAEKERLIKIAESALL